MKSVLQVLGSLGMPKLTDLQQDEPATRTTTAQPSSMVHQGGMGEPERGQKEGKGQPHVQGLPHSPHGRPSSQQWKNLVFPQVKASPSLLLTAHFPMEAALQPKQHPKFLSLPCQLPARHPLHYLFSPDWSTSLTFSSPITSDTKDCVIQNKEIGHELVSRRQADWAEINGFAQTTPQAPEDLQSHNKLPVPPVSSFS